jgi:hypothetical protein
MRSLLRGQALVALLVSLGVSSPVAAQAPMAEATPAALAPSGACPDLRVPPVPDWPLVDGVSQFRTAVDVDGDERPDGLTLEESHGSGGGLFVVKVALADGTSLETEVETSSYAMVMDTPVPAALLLPGRECALALTERLAFGRMEAQPDPSLAWLLAATKSLQWNDGPPRTPESYTVRVRAGDGAHWISYNGGVHTRRLGGEPRPPAVLAQRGESVLLGTFHGVILTNPARSRHAWIYVYPGGDQKLRWPSIRAARIAGSTAVISLEPHDSEGPPRTVRVDLATGRVQGP